jgi:hypothetical protein
MVAVKARADPMYTQGVFATIFLVACMPKGGKAVILFGVGVQFEFGRSVAPQSDLPPTLPRI